MRKRRSLLKDKVVWIMSILAVVSVGVIIIAAVAGNKSNDSETKKNNIIDFNDETTNNVLQNEEPTTKTNSNKPTESNSTENKQNSDDITNPTTEPATEADTTLGSKKNDGVEAGINIKGVLFAVDKTLHWPVVGNIVLDYSMDSTIYFPTLDTYKCNAGIVIQSEVGTAVNSASNGVIKEVNKNEEIGNYVVVDMGKGYTAIYGQLANICVKKDQVIAADAKLGTVAEPTKYYSIEGPNMYFELRENNIPIDPVEYFAY